MTQLPPQPWLDWPETRAVVAALLADGGVCRFVGGCVRDALAGRKVKDIDLATPDPPERTAERLAAAGIKVVPTGIKHGTVTAVVHPRHFEITALRRDVETFGRHARVEFTDDWDADASRRDFTINALSADPQGAVHDPFGGLADLAAGRVRFVGRAADRIREDVLRLLRFFRFHAYYGRGAPDEEALAACSDLAPLAPNLSGERVAGETMRLMLAPDPAAAIALMAEAGVLRYLLPEVESVARLRALVALEAAHAEPDALRRLGALLPADAANAAAVAMRLRLSNAQRDRLIALAAPPIAIAPGLDRSARLRALRRLGGAGFADAALLAWAGQGGDAEDADWAALLAEARAWVPVAFPLKGRDALEAGVAPGAGVGRLLAEVEAWWEERDYRPDRAACLAEMKRRAAAERP